NIKGASKLFLEGGVLKYYLSTDEFDSLRPFMNFLESKIKINDKISAWIYKKIVAKKYKLRYLEGKYDLRKNFFDLNSLKAIARAKSVKVKFHPKVKEVFVKEVSVILKNGNLRFKLKDPLFYDRSLKGSFVKIDSVKGGKNTKIEIFIKTTSPFDEKILSILRAYKINVPVLQTKGVSEGFVDIVIPRFKVKNIEVKGEFSTKDSRFVLDNKIAFDTKKANVLLDNKSIILKNSEISYGNFLDFKTNASIDVSKRSLNGDVFIKKFKILTKEGDKLLDMKGVETKVRVLAGGDKTIIYAPSFSTKIYLSSKKNLFFVKDLSKFFPYSPILQKYELKKGSLDIESKDMKSFEIYANLKDLNFPLYKNGKKLDSLELNILSTPLFLSLSDADDSIRVKIFQDKSVVRLKGIDFLLDKKRIKSTNGKKRKSKKNENTKVIAFDSNIILPNERVLYCDFYDAILKDSLIDFECKKRADKISFVKKGENIYIKANNISEFFINSLSKKNIFEGGRFYFDLHGRDDYKGRLSFKNTTMKELEVFNNLMAFINTIPSLLFLQSPSFSQKGYKIKKGYIDFMLLGDILTFTKIDIKGYSADVLGSGYINLKNLVLDLDLQISTLQNVDKIIGNIPIVGYILLGKDKRNSITVKIRGDVNDPKVETYLIKDIFSMPFNIIKRTLSIPFSVFSDDLEK
ncbi:MAG: DUF3971 domain-containing protein, partial [Epsilonproteobacteria bacterium]|nr:DUF3971 domain-containing protein [Campylobacterota bacterium]